MIHFIEYSFFVHHLQSQSVLRCPAVARLWNIWLNCSVPFDAAVTQGEHWYSRLPVHTHWSEKLA
jgi:hypothetical protein